MHRQTSSESLARTGHAQSLRALPHTRVTAPLVTGQAHPLDISLHHARAVFAPPPAPTLHNFSHSVRSAASVVLMGSFFLVDPILAPDDVATQVSMTSNMELRARRCVRMRMHVCMCV